MNKRDFKIINLLFKNILILSSVDTTNNNIYTQLPYQIIL